MTSMLINGILGLCGFGSCQTVIGLSRSVTDFSAVPRTRNPTLTFAEQPRQFSTTNRSIVETGLRLLCGDGITRASPARLALVDKDELLRPTDRLLLGITEDHPSFHLGAYTFGGVRDVWTTDKVQLGIGSDLTLYSKPSLLDTIYGNHPVSWKLFFRIRPGRMDMSVHGMHGTNGNTNNTVH